MAEKELPVEQHGFKANPVKKCRNCKFFVNNTCELTRVQRGGAPVYPETKAWVSSVVPSVLAVYPDYSCGQWEAANNDANS